VATAETTARRPRSRSSVRRSGAGFGRLGRAYMDVGELLNLGPVPCWSSTARSARRSTSTSTTGWWRGEVVLVEDKLGVTMTEIIKSDRIDE
jgi:hypothetical protein